MAKPCICKDPRWVNAACQEHGVNSAANEPVTEDDASAFDRLMGPTE